MNEFLRLAGKTVVLNFSSLSVWGGGGLTRGLDRAPDEASALFKGRVSGLKALIVSVGGGESGELKKGGQSIGGIKPARRIRGSKFIYRAHEWRIGSKL